MRSAGSTGPRHCRTRTRMLPRHGCPPNSIFVEPPVVSTEEAAIGGILSRSRDVETAPWSRVLYKAAEAPVVSLGVRV